jgi:hypothetical protein
MNCNPLPFPCYTSLDSYFNKLYFPNSVNDTSDTVSMETAGWI